MIEDGLSPTERQEYLSRVQALYQQNIVPTRGFLNLYGYTESNEFVLAPDSYAVGYRHGLNPYAPHPTITLNLFGLFGQLTDKTWIFLPSYTRGFSYGQSKQNDLKFAILAEGERRLFQANADAQKNIHDLTKKVSELERELNELKRDSKGKNQT